MNSWPGSVAYCVVGDLCVVLLCGGSVIGMSPLHLKIRQKVLKTWQESVQIGFLKKVLEI